jgi:hypothetical protein
VYEQVHMHVDMQVGVSLRVDADIHTHELAKICACTIACMLCRKM